MKTTDDILVFIIAVSIVNFRGVEWRQLVQHVAHETSFYTPPDQLFINKISSLLPHLYLANTSEYQEMYLTMYTWIHAFNIFEFNILFFGVSDF